MQPPRWALIRHLVSLWSTPAQIDMPQLELPRQEITLFLLITNGLYRYEMGRAATKADRALTDQVTQPHAVSQNAL